jgi:hypothetical protein
MKISESLRKEMNSLMVAQFLSMSKVTGFSQALEKNKQNETNKNEMNKRYSGFN